VKPSWNPPNWLFAPVWTALYVMIAVAGALAWRAGAAARTMGFWGLQMALNALWTLLFFGLRRPDLALIEVALLWLVIVGFIVSVWPVERRAGWLMLPYLAWVSFAAVLNGAIWWLNR
jgi:translocator protein